MGYNGKKATYTTTIRIRISENQFSEIDRYSALLSQKTSDFVRSAISYYIKHIRNVQHVSSELNKLKKC